MPVLGVQHLLQFAHSLAVMFELFEDFIFVLKIAGIAGSYSSRRTCSPISGRSGCFLLIGIFSRCRTY